MKIAQTDGEVPVILSPDVPHARMSVVLSPRAKTIILIQMHHTISTHFTSTLFS